MSVPTLIFLLVHSPLVGPTTWTPVAEEIRKSGFEVIVPRLDSPAPISGTYRDRHARIVAEAVAKVPRTSSIVLVGHSGAGPLLPAIREAMHRKVAGYIFFDAGLPLDRASRLDQFDTEAERREFRAAAVNGILPKWTDDDLKDSIKDDTLRRAFVAELPALPLAVYEEPLPVFKGWPDAPCAYVRTSATYDRFLATAKTKGWYALSLDGGHFYMLNEPAETARLLKTMAVFLMARAGAPPNPRAPSDRH
ncbi:MAG TPA: alpha/beta fold hydrolase [Candidatus Polarisedimenticolia bacterium]|nr:alpha/beta fold hydrolase [Candidatus Polarisedimenticolia bacterium]